MIFHSKRDKNTEKQALFPPNPSANRATPPSFLFSPEVSCLYSSDRYFLWRILSERDKV
ncbi:hypothetical protein HMPREF1554_01528 [Porphyromonas gingivalis F0569]|nr:hypothetical protein HMPREF1554_01528 [Porphyromonas gingivalis F0569]